MKDLTIFALSCAVVGLVLALLWRKAKEETVAPKDRDLFNYEGLGDRLNHTERESRLENHP